jgi:serine/threonine protein kinase
LIINIIHGLRHLISYGIVHLDLKPINILVCRAYITKIIDFGESYHPDICPKSKKYPILDYTPGRTYPYTAP